MARQRVHNRRAGRGAAGGGASWISYSDMMAALLLVFVLILCVSLWQYFTMLETKTVELNEKEALLAVQQTTLNDQAATMAAQQLTMDEQKATLDEQSATLAAQQATLDEQESTLAAQAAALAAQQAALDATLATLATREAELTGLQAELDDQAATLAELELTLSAQAAALADQQATMDEQALVLSAQSTALDDANTSLADKEKELLILQAQLATQQAALKDAQALLDEKQNALNSAQVLLGEQQAAMQSQAEKIDALVGVRSQIITDLSNAFARKNLRATVDPTNGDIKLDSAVFFKTNSNELRPEGKALLNEFVPVYLSVLLRKEYSDFLGEIIIEGHTDTDGEYMHNLELSQKRALSVAMYCLEIPGLSDQQQKLLREILTATGRSESNPVYVNGKEDKQASRRVEFKFSLKDAQMIDEMNRLLSGQ